MLQMQAWKKLSQEQKTLWKIGGSVLLFGHLTKYFYFKFTSALFSEQMERNDRIAQGHLKETRAFSGNLHTKHNQSVPALTQLQRRDLESYLALRRKKRPDLFD